MSHNDFNQLLNSLDALSPAQMERLSRELESKRATTPNTSRSTADPVLGSVSDHRESMDQIVEQAKARRQQCGTAATPTADSPELPARAHKPIWEVAAELRESIPAQEWAKLPKDGAAQHDHYIYGVAKRPTT